MPGLPRPEYVEVVTLSQRRRSAVGQKAGAQALDEQAGNGAQTVAGEALYGGHAAGIKQIVQYTGG